MTATPIQNSLNDLFAAFHFLKYKPYSEYTSWKASIMNNPRRFEKLQTLLNPLMLRRTKQELEQERVQGQEQKQEEKQEDEEAEATADECNMFALPPRILEFHEIEFTENERTIYEQLQSCMSQVFDGYAQNSAVGKNFSRCLAMLSHLRQICNDLRLARNKIAQIQQLLIQGGNQMQTQNQILNVEQLLLLMRGGEDNDNENGNNNNNSNSVHKKSETYLSEIKRAIECADGEECPICKIGRAHV
jgi:SNF2 family DNA or RNA helicase